MADLPQAKIDLGPLEGLIADDTVSKIYVNGPYDIFVRRRGIEKVDLAFESEQQLRKIIEQILAPLGRRLDENSPMAAVRLSDGSRLHVILPPVALNGCTLTIHKPSTKLIALGDLRAWGAISKDMATFLDACVKARLNVVVSGGVNSGKTTLVNALASTIPTEERIVTIEEMVEFRLPQKHVVTLESHPPDAEGRGQVTIHDLVLACPDMGPNRVLVGELNGAETLEVLRLMDRGYDGMMTTVSANSPQEALERIEMMVKMNSPNLPVSYLRLLIGSAIDLILQGIRLEDGTRKVARVTEVLRNTGAGYDLNDVFAFQRTGVEGGRVIGRFESYPISSSLRQHVQDLGLYAALPSPLVASLEGEERPDELIGD